VNKNKYKIVFEAMIKSSSIEEPTSPLRLGRHILHELGEFWYRKPFFFFFSGDVAITSQETNKRLRHAARATTNARRQKMQEEVVVLRCG
jgi:hypothetical protein